jgi:hypothetical protein
MILAAVAALGLVAAVASQTRRRPGVGHRALAAALIDLSRSADP